MKPGLKSRRGSSDAEAGEAARAALRNATASKLAPDSCVNVRQERDGMVGGNRRDTLLTVHTPQPGSQLKVDRRGVFRIRMLQNSTVFLGPDEDEKEEEETSPPLPGPGAGAGEGSPNPLANSSNSAGEGTGSMPSARAGTSGGARVSGPRSGGDVTALVHARKQLTQVSRVVLGKAVEVAALTASTPGGKTAAAEGAAGAVTVGSALGSAGLQVAGLEGRSLGGAPHSSTHGGGGAGADPLAGVKPLKGDPTAAANLAKVMRRQIEEVKQHAADVYLSYEADRFTRPGGLTGWAHAARNRTHAERMREAQSIASYARTRTLVASKDIMLAAYQGSSSVPDHGLAEDGGVGLGSGLGTGMSMGGAQGAGLGRQGGGAGGETSRQGVPSSGSSRAGAAENEGSGLSRTVSWREPSAGSTAAEAAAMGIFAPLVAHARTELAERIHDTDEELGRMAAVAADTGAKPAATAAASHGKR